MTQNVVTQNAPKTDHFIAKISQIFQVGGTTPHPLPHAQPPHGLRPLDPLLFFDNSHSGITASQTLTNIYVCYIQQCQWQRSAVAILICVSERFIVISCVYAKIRIESELG